MLREGPFDHIGAGEKPRDSLRVHDERTHAVGGVFICFEVRNVGAAPGAAVPGDECPLAIEWLAARITGCAVVENAAIGRPGECPVDGLADPRRVGVVTASHEIARRSPGAAKDPAAARGAAVVAQLCEPGELLACLA